ncbi:type 2 periplasmic-binding domain-containing protein [Profundibacter amoris]|uniref:hypothetical protein n=1 Tax=Profundibacter amoris TaxID=2171755 RepID=UPI0013C33EB7|nr:hypothetical protein [Profundibacter amoris]
MSSETKWSSFIILTEPATHCNETLRVLCELDALDTIAIMVQSGLGVAVVPKWAGLVDRFPDMRFQPIGKEARKIGLLCRTHQADHPALKLIRGAIV